MKKLFTITAMLLFVISANAQKSEIFCTAGKAIKGYDPVAFFKEAKPVKGVDSLSYTYKEATWSFSSTANMDAFKANPEKYAPQYGGYCAYGASDGSGHKAPAQTDTWTIVDGKLYFNYNAKVKEMWTKQQPALIERANANWASIKDKP